MENITTGGTTAPPGSRPGRRWGSDGLVLALACLGQFMVILDVSIVNVALPDMKRDLGFSSAGLQWVLNAYTLTFAGFLLLGGRAADHLGRRRAFLGGLALFTAASLVGGFAQNQAMLIAARAVQGLGGAVLSPATLTLLTTTFTEPRARARAMAMWSAVAGGGGAFGAFLGGVLTQELSWRWILFINVPIGAVVLVLGRLGLPESRAPLAEGERRNLDMPGGILVTLAATALVFGIVRTEAVGWASWQTATALAVGVVLLAWFLVHEARFATRPLVPLRLFRLRAVSSANIAMFLVGGALFPMWYFLSLYFQQVHGYSALRAGFAFLPQPLAIAVGAQIAGRLLNRTGARPLVVVGAALSALGMGGLALLSPSSSYWPAVFIPGVLTTLGVGIVFTPLAFAATAGVPRQEAGLASGVINTSRQIGGALGLAAVATVAASRTQSVAAAHGHLVGKDALTSGFTTGFAVSAGMLAVAVLAALAIPRVRRNVEETAPQADGSATDDDRLSPDKQRETEEGATTPC